MATLAKQLEEAGEKIKNPIVLENRTREQKGIPALEDQNPLLTRTKEEEEEEEQEDNLSDQDIEMKTLSTKTSRKKVDLQALLVSLWEPTALQVPLALLKVP